jgi:3-oxoacyl-[acyl-carrier-protein] synthase II
MGLISPVGETVAEAWHHITHGISGVRPIEDFDTTLSNIRVAAQVRGWDPTRYMLAKEARKRDRYQQFIAAAGAQAFADSGLTLTDANRHRVGVMIGSSVGGVTSYYQEVMNLVETGDPRRVTPYGIPMLMVNGGSTHVAIAIGATGPSVIVASACATGTDCIGTAFDLVRWGRADAMVAGGGDAPIYPIGLLAFDRTGACARTAEPPDAASRPFSRDRTGLVFSEGAGVVVLEALEHAQARGARIYAEVIGYGATSDAHHITAPHPDGGGAARAILLALEDAAVPPEAVDYINAHGTATGLNDAMETKAVKTAFGRHAYDIPISSTKSMTGHAMAATGAFEVIWCALAMRDSVMPPTINLDEPDPECDLDYIPHHAREKRLRVTMTNSFGFGGHNASLVLRAFPGGGR